MQAICCNLEDVYMSFILSNDTPVVNVTTCKLHFTQNDITKLLHISLY